MFDVVVCDDAVISPILLCEHTTTCCCVDPGWTSRANAKEFMITAWAPNAIISPRIKTTHSSNINNATTTAIDEQKAYQKIEMTK